MVEYQGSVLLEHRKYQSTQQVPHADLMLERTLGTKRWAHRVNMSLFSMLTFYSKARPL
jgi:hypothetical protein